MIFVDKQYCEYDSSAYNLLRSLSTQAVYNYRSLYHMFASYVCISFKMADWDCLCSKVILCVFCRDCRGNAVEPVLTVLFSWYLCGTYNGSL